LTVRLTCVGRTYIRQSPSNTTAEEGSKVTLTCRAEASMKNISYQWYRDDVNVQIITQHQQLNQDDDDDEIQGQSGQKGGRRRTRTRTRTKRTGTRRRIT